MSSKDQIRHAIGKLADGIDRKPFGGDRQAVFEGILTEIDETVLPRWLTFLGGLGEVELLVASRRLIRSRDGDVVSTENEDTLSAIRAEIEEKLVGSDVVTIKSRSASDDLDIGAAGVSIAALREIWALDAHLVWALSPNEILERLRDGCAGMVRAENGSVKEANGAAESLQELALAAAELGESILILSNHSVTNALVAMGGEAEQTAILVDSKTAFAALVD